MKSKSSNPLKPQSAPKARMPNARAERYFISKVDRRPYITRNSTPLAGVRAYDCVILPFPTAKAARAFVKVANMTQEERVEFVGAQLFHPLADYDRAKYPDEIRKEQAAAVLSALSFPQAGGGK